jgi:predicted SprT family Zn-dependent metalloprotease
MTNELSVEEAIELLKDKRMEINYKVNGATQFSEALDMAIKALEKDIAKESTQTHVRYGMGYEYHDYFCPVCDQLLVPEPKGNRWKQEGGWSRCQECGQKIKWESESE